MVGKIAFATAALSIFVAFAQSPAARANPAPRPNIDAFEVATIKPVDSTPKSGRFIKQQGDRFVARDYTLKLLIAAAYDLNPRTISGGPAWVDSDHYDILAVTPGPQPPTHDEQMSMLRNLLIDRFQLTTHRKPKVFSIYALQIEKTGSKLKASTSSADTPAVMGPGVVYPNRVVLPARNATMTSFVSLLQRAVLDRPVVDQTGLTGRYDFSLEWAPDETQFGGDLTPASDAATVPPFFEAIQQQLGLKLLATRGPVDALIIDTVQHPSAN